MNNAKLIEILEAALTWHDASMREFENMQDAENERDDYMAKVYWSTCMEYGGKSDGLLMAYAFLTGRSIYQHEIKSELEMLQSIMSH